MFVHHVRAIALTGIVLLTAAPVSACLVCTPAPKPTPTPMPVPVRDRPTPAPPATMHYSEIDGWRIGIGQYDPDGTACNRFSSFIGQIYPGRNTTFAYYFKHSDGLATGVVQVPAAPNIPNATFGGKKVVDERGPLQAGVGDSLVVIENGQTIQTEMLPTACK